jgi:hypothetical protein
MNMLGAVLGGLAGPLVAAVATWVVVVRTHRANPAAVHSVMLVGFAVKAVFFGIYCIAMVKVFDLDVTTFGLSFAAFFIAAYAVEAYLFARLFRTPSPGAR